MKYLSVIFILLIINVTWGQYNPIDANTVAFWKIGTNITTISDSVNKWTDAVGGRNVAQNSSGKYPYLDGDTLEFDGTTDILRMAVDDTTLDPYSHDWTVEVRYVHKNSSGALVARQRNFHTGAYAGWSIRQYTIGQSIFYCSDGTNGTTATTGTSVLTEGQVHTLAYVIDRTKDSILVYVNGVFKNNSDLSSVGDIKILNPTYPNYYLAFGCTSDSTSGFADTKILTVRISDKSRSTSELLNFHNYPTGTVDAFQFYKNSYPKMYINGYKEY